jgi:hypothetical protein
LLLGLFAVSIGLPFFALSANGPLLQAWFARTANSASFCMERRSMAHSASARPAGPTSGRPEPLTYYHVTSPIAQGIKAARERKNGPIRLAVVGLGTGSTACLTEPDDRLTYYEIQFDGGPHRQGSQSIHLSGVVRARCGIVIGDTRLILADADDGQYDVFVVNAFTSDAINHVQRRAGSQGVVTYNEASQIRREVMEGEVERSPRGRRHGQGSMVS